MRQLMNPQDIRKRIHQLVDRLSEEDVRRGRVRELDEYVAEREE